MFKSVLNGVCACVLNGVLNSGFKYWSTYCLSSADVYVYLYTRNTHTWVGVARCGWTGLKCVSGDGSYTNDMKPQI